MQTILVAGSGPAGAAAAIAARMEGAPVRVIDRAATFRHKVCGEFISPGAPQILQALGVWDEFAAAGPYRIRRCILHLGNRARRWNLPECAWGLSRLQLDRLLVQRAAALGAVIARGETFDLRHPHRLPSNLVVTCGRRQCPAQGDRLFGFKAHFEGPSDDAVELFFDRSGYIGVSGIEDGLTNICGIAPESLLRRYGFDFDAIALRSHPLSERIRPLRRRMRWIVTGPLSFSIPSAWAGGKEVYAAGDSLGFADPFTGTGILNALLTGRLAGIASARRISSQKHLRECRAILRRPFLVSSLLRCLIGSTAMYWLAPYLPAQALFRLTRASGGKVSRLDMPDWRSSES